MFSLVRTYNSMRLYVMNLVLSAVDEESLLDGLLLLAALLDSLAGTLCISTKDKLSLEFPLLGNVPVALCLLVDDRVVVLKVASTAFGSRAVQRWYWAMALD